jgi:hypothetical protein
MAEEINMLKILAKVGKDMKWNQLAQDSVRKKALMKTVLNIQGIF